MCECKNILTFFISFPSAIYDVDEEQEKLDLEPDFQYIPEMSGLELSHSEADSLRSSIQLPERWAVQRVPWLHSLM